VSNATATAKAGPKPGQMVQDKDAPKPIPESRLVPSAFVHNEMQHVCLEGDQRIEEGEQDIRLWALIGGKLGMHTWVEVVNDAGSIYRLMRVERVFGSPSTGLRGLWLRDLVPPQFIDRTEEPIGATGEWRFEWRGPYKKWVVVSPQGIAKFEYINTEQEARAACVRESGNPKPR